MSKYKVIIAVEHYTSDYAYDVPHLFEVEAPSAAAAFEIARQMAANGIPEQDTTRKRAAQCVVGYHKFGDKFFKLIHCTNVEIDTYKLVSKVKHQQAFPLQAMTSYDYKVVKGLEFPEPQQETLFIMDMHDFLKAVKIGRTDIVMFEPLRFEDFKHFGEDIKKRVIFHDGGAMSLLCLEHFKGLGVE